MEKNTGMINIRKLTESEICRGLFSDFVRRQQVSKVWRKTDGEWQIKDEPFTDDWDEEDWEYIVRCLKNTASTGGMVSGAFSDGKLKGFVSVEGAKFGSCNQYMDMFCLHVSSDMRRQGVAQSCFAPLWISRAKAERKSCISRRSLLPRHRTFIGLWAVSPRWNKAPLMLIKNLPRFSLNM